MTDLSHTLHAIPVQSTNDSSPPEDLTDIIREHHQRSLEEEKDRWEPSSLNQLDYFGFTTHPFSDSVNPDFFYDSNVHELAFKKMLMTIQEDISLGLVHGVSGTGKTLLTQMLLTHLDPATYRPVLILVSPGMSKTSLLKEILRELVEEDRSLPAQTQALLDLLHGQIIDLYRKNIKLVVLIDEAHFLSSESLHILRTISNLETPEKKLCTCILFAEDLFLRRLSHPSYQSLRNRMYMKVPLTPMDQDETVQYLKFRLLSAGSKYPIVHNEAYEMIHKGSGGICREINRISHNCLTEVYLKKGKIIDGEIVRYVLG